ncbi:hypothetical protein BTCD_0243 [Brochothrix thermosphacta]|nr:hypothetical protein BTCD_0243 [Brochothrix thermosphacta]
MLHDSHVDRQQSFIVMTKFRLILDIDPYFPIATSFTIITQVCVFH